MNMVKCGEKELYSKTVGTGGNHGSIFFLCCTGCNFLTLQ